MDRHKQAQTDQMSNGINLKKGKKKKKKQQQQNSINKEERSSDAQENRIHSKTKSILVHTWMRCRYYLAKH